MSRRRSQVHEPGCPGPTDRHYGLWKGCGGYVRCRSCGGRFGWCAGIDTDLGLCPDCCAVPGKDPLPPLNYPPHEVAVYRDDRGKFVSEDVSPIP